MQTYLGVLGEKAKSVELPRVLDSSTTGRGFSPVGKGTPDLDNVKFV